MHVNHVGLIFTFTSFSITAYISPSHSSSYSWDTKGKVTIRHTGRQKVWLRPKMRQPLYPGSLLLAERGMKQRQKNPILGEAGDRTLALGVQDSFTQ